MNRDEADRAFHALSNAVDYFVKAIAEHPYTAVEHHQGIVELLELLEELVIEAKEQRIAGGQFGMGA